MSRPTPVQWAALCDQAAGHLERLRRDGPGLVVRGRHRVSDGYPTSSLGGGATSSTGHGDPVGELVAAGPQRDPTGADIGLMVFEFGQVLDRLQRADNARHRAMGDPARCEWCESPNKGDPCRVHSENARLGCVNCARFGVFSVATKAERCPPCYEYHRRHDGIDAPESVVTEREFHPARKRGA